MRLARSVRRLLRASKRLIPNLDPPPPLELKVAPQHRNEEIERFIRSVDLPDESARGYLDVHMHRIVRTLTMVPPPGKTGGVLELGAYMQMTPPLGCVFGYREVRGAYFGPLGRVDTKTASSGGKEIFRCFVDLFDAERDRFPYEDDRFDVVLCCELIEHLLLDPMQMLLEIRRVLSDDGRLILTTPNIASFTAVARLLLGHENPQLYSMYPNPHGEYRDTEIPHVREYTPHELAQVVRAAGFEIEYIFTEKIAGYDADIYFREILEENDYPTEFRGEQTYCRARKLANAPVTRYPAFLYEGC